jgi:hypothetical protein
MSPPATSAANPAAASMDMRGSRALPRTRMGRIALLSFGILALIVFALWYPYSAGSVPEWRIQIMDNAGHGIAGAQANQEWLNPIEDGIVKSDSRTTDSNGMVVFPRRALQNRLALGLPKLRPSAHIFVCWQDQYGDISWDDNNRKPAAQLVLKQGSCPYG